MSYKVEAIDVTSTPKERVVDPRSKKGGMSTPKMYQWWNAQSDKDLVSQVLSTTQFLKKTNLNRIRQASVFSRLFSGKPLYNYLAANASLDSSNQLPIGRPTANVCYSCTDTLTSRISQDRPKTVFLTDGGHYKQRKLAEQANSFLQGEFFRTKTYDLMALQVKDSCVLGNGFIKVFPWEKKVALNRTLETELLTDFNDAYYNDPRQLIQMKLVDREVMQAHFSKASTALENAVAGNVDSTPRSVETVSDQIILAEAWHRRSSESSNDGRHVIVCSEGVVCDESWDKDGFPFAKLSYNPNMVGWFSQGLIEILMPTQMEIYRMLIVASQAIELMGVPRIYIDEMSKIIETSFNNRIGTIIKGRGTTPPQFLNATSNAPEIYQWIIWLIQNAYQMSGISSMSAAGTKPAGLNSGESIREFDAIQNDRFAAFQRRYQNVAVDLSYLIVDTASDIAEEYGSYETVYPGKDGTQRVDFKNIKMLKDTFVIQCFEESSLPKDPAGRQAKLSEMLAAGEIDNKEFRRLSNFPDLKQSDQLASALEERILWSLDDIVENGKKNWDELAPDSFILDPSDLATTLCVNYINLYSTLELEDDKMELLRDWFTLIQNLKKQAAPPPVAAAASPQTTGGPGGLTPPTAPPAPPVGPASNVQV